ncbi:DUF4817 domain-containing protein [Trichonephila clavipes]|uniref:DUF4817 domain-containing protein n=1 Tax=Trichonephila clavipes TaxID=2585209 RepID=A0A8X6WJN7_TRICX|nr:DUF4817 domain-containing protein [Trichonephila clavipes]
MGPNEIAVVPDFYKRILFSDEVHFWLKGYVNIQNCRIWSEAYPQVYVETPLHPEKLTVWCALWASGIIGPYFFKNDEGHNVPVNGDRYRAMITNFFIPEFFFFFLLLLSSFTKEGGGDLKKESDNSPPSIAEYLFF